MTSRLRRVVLLIVLVGIVGAGGYILLRTFGERELNAAQQAIEKRDFLQAGEHLENHLAAHPNDLEARMSAAQTARRRGDSEAAGRHLRLFLVQGGPRDAAKLERDLLALQNGDLADFERLVACCIEYPDAIETPAILEAAIVGGANHLAAPFSMHALNNPSIDQQNILRRTMEAVELWLKLRTGSFDRAQGLVWRGRIEQLAGKHAEAIRDLRAAIALDPDHFEGNVHLALFLSQESPEEACRRLEALAVRSPDDSRVLFPLSTMLHSLGRLNEAEQLLAKLVELQPSAALVWLERGTVALDRQNAAQAEPWLRKAIALDPNDSDSYFALNRCLILLGRPEEAKRHRDRFLELEAKRTQSKTQPIKSP